MQHKMKMRQEKAGIVVGYLEMSAITPVQEVPKPYWSLEHWEQAVPVLAYHSGAPSDFHTPLGWRVHGQELGKQARR